MQFFRPATFTTRELLGTPVVNFVEEGVILQIVLTFPIHVQIPSCFSQRLPQFKGNCVAGGGHASWIERPFPQQGRGESTTVSDYNSLF